MSLKLDVAKRIVFRTKCHGTSFSDFLQLSKCHVGVAEASQPSSPTHQLSKIASERRRKELTNEQLERFERLV